MGQDCAAGSRGAKPTKIISNATSKTNRFMLLSSSPRRKRKRDATKKSLLMRETDPPVAIPSMTKSGKSTRRRHSFLQLSNQSGSSSPDGTLVALLSHQFQIQGGIGEEDAFSHCRACARLAFVGHGTGMGQPLHAKGWNSGARASPE
jgi:hypothetical protein